MRCRSVITRFSERSAPHDWRTLRPGLDELKPCFVCEQCGFSMVRKHRAIGAAAGTPRGDEIENLRAIEAEYSDPRRSKPQD